METLDAIAARRSIRRFRDEPVPRELLGRILEATCQAPSGKNRQPWRFVVVEGEDDRTEMIRVLREGIEAAREAGWDLGSSENTASIMEQAPVTVFFFNAMNTDEDEGESPFSVVDVQSIGGAIQTMLLAAEDLGLGTLWICDVFYAYDGLRKWLGRTDQMVAAVSLGYADEAPDARPRIPWQDLTTWQGEG
jgi:nitroreductase